MNHYDVLDKFALLDTEEDLELLEVDDEADEYGDDDDEAYGLDDLMGDYGWDDCEV